MSAAPTSPGPSPALVLPSFRLGVRPVTGITESVWSSTRLNTTKVSKVCYVHDSRIIYSQVRAGSIILNITSS